MSPLYLCGMHVGKEVIFTNKDRQTVHRGILAGFSVESEITHFYTVDTKWGTTVVLEMVARLDDGSEFNTQDLRVEVLDS